MNIRNVAIIAHVDHGKTTLVDALLRQSKTHLHKDIANSDLIMDSNELERERGITIFSKNASVNWRDTKINIIDTPGHADFGGEVERVLKMADGCLLLIDAKEGPMPQTRFVLKNALKMKQKIIVVVNKCDKVTLLLPNGESKIDTAALDRVISKTFDLFLELGADEDAAYFPVVYCSGKLGKAGLEPEIEKMENIDPIFEAIVEHIPAPSGDPNAPLQILVTTINADNFMGRIATGRVYNGSIRMGQDIMYINRLGEMKKHRVTSLMTYEGLGRVDAKEVLAGDIVAVSGIADITIGETLADVNNPIAMPLLFIEEPTVRMTFGVNTSPFAGQEGEFKTSRQIRERLFKAMEADVALKVEDDGPNWIVSGRGELHLAILIERLRREGYEFQVARPQVINRDIDGVKSTPYERLFLEVPEAYSGIVMQKLGIRHASMADMNTENGIVFLEFIIATKELFGYRSEFVTDTRGMGVFNSAFFEYRPDTNVVLKRDRGSLVAHENGVTKLYGLIQVQDRGVLFVGPGERVYRGQVIGQNTRESDMSVNVCKEKQLTNIRSKGEGVSEHFNAPKKMDLEDALEYIDETELVEVTPKKVRIRKIDLNGTR